MKSTEELIIECIRILLKNEGYTTYNTDVAIQWSYADMQPIIELIKEREEAV